MEARVKERLTGAAVLVALVVIVVPELLSGPKHHAATPAGAHTVKIDLDGPHRLPPPEPAPAAGALPPPPAPVGVAPRLGGDVVPQDSPSPDADPTAEVATPPPDAEGVASDGPAPPAVVAAKAAPAAPAKGSAAEPAAAQKAANPTSPAPAAPATPAAVAGWVVQLGSFASRENAQKLVTELQHKGYRAFIAEYRGKEKTLFRVRIGPEQDRGRADALKMRLGHDGYNGSVTPHP